MRILMPDMILQIVVAVKEAKKVQLACLEFRGYAATWWEMQQERRQRNQNPPIDNWEEMKGFMCGRFIPVHYERELEKKLNRIKQGTRSIEEYHKELETTLNRVGKEETLNATIIRYIEGMNPYITCEVELKEFTSIERMVQYASIVEKQLREGHHRSSQTSAPTHQSWSKGQSDPPERCFDHSTPQSSRRLESTPRPTFQRPNPPNTMLNSAPSRARDIQCHKYKGWGHFQNQCPNRRVLFLNEHNGLISASKDEEEPQAAAPEAVDVPEVKPDDEESELPHVSLVSIRSLNINREDEEQSQRENIFYTRVAIKDQTYVMIIDSGSVINAISQYAVDKLALTTTKHPKPYKLQWLTDHGSIRVTEDQERMQERFKQERAKQAATAVRTTSVATSEPSSTPSSTNAAPKTPSNDSLANGKASRSAPSKEKNRSLFISVKGVEKALKTGLPFVLLSYKDSATNGVSLPCDV
ncbi:hypothetical protein C2S52_001454 [Perilla frutescens var. hirtella]|nr:hypothetical protein C2S52_001454 [Perilla frutescens var. hirtella]